MSFIARNCVFMQFHYTHEAQKWGTFHIMSPAQKVGVMSPCPSLELHPCKRSCGDESGSGW